MQRASIVLAITKGPSMTSWQICLFVVFISIFVHVVARKLTVDRINTFISSSMMFFFNMQKLTIKLASILAVLDIEKRVSEEILSASQNVTSAAQNVTSAAQNVTR